MDIQLLTVIELVDRLMNQASQSGHAKGVLHAYSIVKEKDRDVLKNTSGGVISSMRPLTEATRRELLRRLGVTASPEVTNRAAFIYLAEKRSHSACGNCHKEVRGGRGINFWTKDRMHPDPLLLIMAHNGASVEKLMAAAKMCLPLCRLCAKNRGAKLLENGNVDLKQYL